MQFLKFCALALGVFAGPAAAATVEVVWTGIVSEGVDGAGTDLAGQQITMAMTYDTGKGLYKDDGTTISLIGGSVAGGGEDPMVSSLVTVGGSSYFIEGKYMSGLYLQDKNPPDYNFTFDNFQTFASDAYGLNGGEYISGQFYNGDYVEAGFSAYLYGFTDFLPYDLQTSFNVTDMSGRESYGLVSIITSELGVDPNFGGHTRTDVVTINAEFFITSLTVTVTDDVAPVPLPASALLLLGAVGGLGVLRLRRRGCKKLPV